MAEFDFEFDFDNEDEFSPNTFKDKVEKQRLREFEQEMQVNHSSVRHAKIAELAYYKAEQRGFKPGLELDDWLEAETELLRQEESRRKG